VTMLEGVLRYGLKTSRVAAFKEPEPKEWRERIDRAAQPA